MDGAAAPPPPSALDAPAPPSVTEVTPKKRRRSSGGFGTTPSGRRIEAPELPTPEGGRVILEVPPGMDCPPDVAAALADVIDDIVSRDDVVRRMNEKSGPSARRRSGTPATDVDPAVAYETALRERAAAYADAERTALDEALNRVWTPVNAHEMSAAQASYISAARAECFPSGTFVAMSDDARAGLASDVRLVAALAFATRLVREATNTPPDDSGDSASAPTEGQRAPALNDAEREGGNASDLAAAEGVEVERGAAAEPTERKAKKKKKKKKGSPPAPADAESGAATASAAAEAPPGLAPDEARAADAEISTPRALAAVAERAARLAERGARASEVVDLLRARCIVARPRADAPATEAEVFAESPTTGSSARVSEPALLRGAVVRALFDFKAEHGDELDLVAGQHYLSLEILAGDEWWRGRTMDGVLSGIAPCAFVEELLIVLPHEPRSLADGASPGALGDGGLYPNGAAQTPTQQKREQRQRAALYSSQGVDFACAGDRVLALATGEGRVTTAPFPDRLCEATVVARFSNGDALLLWHDGWEDASKWPHMQVTGPMFVECDLAWKARALDDDEDAAENVASANEARATEGDGDAPRASRVGGDSDPHPASTLPSTLAAELATEVSSLCTVTFTRIIAHSLTRSP